MSSFLLQNELVYAANSAAYNASVLSSPGPFSKMNPANGAINLPANITLSWGASSNAVSYEYCLFTTASCTSPATWISPGTNTSANLSGVPAAGKYYWQVRANNTGGTTYSSGSSTSWRYFLPLVESSPSGNTYYVATNGNDAHPGTLAQPFRSIQKGINKLVAGDTLYIRGGTYAEHVAVHVVGTSSNRITISGYPGETAVIDASTFPTEDLAVEIFGAYITVQNLEITNTVGGGIRIWKNYNASSGQTGSNGILDNLFVHNTLYVGISAFGDYSLIENNIITKTNLSNDCDNRNPDPGIGCGYPYWSGALSFGNSGNPYYGLNTTVRNNDVYQNYGEGILCMYTDNSLIEGNRVWDNWAEDIYTDQCSYTTIKNNLSYYTTDHEYWRFSGLPASGIMFSNEGIIKSHPIGHDLKIYNNIVVNAGFGIYFWSGFASGSAAINTTIAYNTIVNNYNYGYGTSIEAPKNASHQNTIIEDNITLTVGTPLAISTTTGLSFSHNLWSKTPVYLGSGDIVGDPLLNDPTQSVDVSIDPSRYQITSLSPGIGKALNVPYIQTDYFWVTRDSSPDIGADEFSSP